MYQTAVTETAANIDSRSERSSVRDDVVEYLKMSRLLLRKSKRASKAKVEIAQAETLYNETPLARQIVLGWGHFPHRN